MTFDQKVRAKLWFYLSDDVSNCVGITFGQLRLYLSNGTGLTDEQVDKLARRIHVVV